MLLVRKSYSIVIHCCPFVEFSIAEFLGLSLAEGSLILRMPMPSLTALSDIRLGMHRTREPSAKLSLRNSAIENATKGQQCS